MKLGLIAVIVAVAIGSPLAVASQPAALTSSETQLLRGVDAWVQSDYPTALRILLPLAEQGVPAAQSHLGLMYKLGQGVPQNYVQAYKWTSLAAAAGDPVFGDSTYAKQRDAIASLMTAATVAEGQELASKWKPK